MQSVDPTPDDAPRDVARCPACRAATAPDQRYCLDCGTLIGERRLDPIELLTADAAVDPVGGPPSGAAAAAPRAVPLAAATAAIVVAGISGMLVTNGGDGTGARAAVIAAAPAAAPAPAPATEPDPAPAPATEDPEPPAEEPLPVDEPLPVEEPLPAASEAPPVETDTSSEDPVDEDAGDEDAADEPAEEPKPRVWLLALEGPQAAEAVERIAAQGVRLSGMTGVAAASQANASALVGGTRPVVGDPSAGGVDPAAGAAGGTNPAGAGTGTGTGSTNAPGTADDAAPSLPAALKAADRRWRAYVDVQPTSGPALPGACAAPAAGDPAATLLASRLPFAGLEGIDCETSVTGLETLGNDLSAGEDIPDFSYVAMGGCPAPERPPVALPDAVEDAVATITASTEYQSDGMLVVTTVGTQDACTPTTPAPAGPTAPPVDPAAPAPAAPTVVLRPAATAGKAVDAKLDLLALSRAMAEVLGLAPPGAAGEDAVPALALPGVAKR